MNASAIRATTGKFYIVVTMGAVWKLFRFVDQWFSCAPIAALLPRAAGPTLITRENYLAIERDEDGLPVMTQDIGRAASLALGPITALIFHELGHIINGHLSVVPASAISDGDREPAPQPADKLTVIRTLEFDADAFSTLRTIQQFYARQPSGFAMFATDPEDYLRYALLSQWGLYLVLAKQSPFHPNWLSTNATHPPAAVRAVTADLTAKEIMRKVKPQELPALVANVFAPVLSAATESYSLLMGAVAHRDEASTAEKGQVFVDAHKAYSKAVWACWATIRPQLVVAKFGTHKLAP